MSELPPPAWIRSNNNKGDYAAECMPIVVTQRYPDGLVCTTPLYIQIDSYTPEPSWISGLLLNFSSRIVEWRNRLFRRI